LVHLALAGQALDQLAAEQTAAALVALALLEDLQVGEAVGPRQKRLGRGVLRGLAAPRPARLLEHGPGVLLVRQQREDVAEQLVLMPGEQARHQVGARVLPTPGSRNGVADALVCHPTYSRRAGAQCQEMSGPAPSVSRAAAWTASTCRGRASGRASRERRARFFWAAGTVRAAVGNQGNGSATVQGRPGSPLDSEKG